MPASIIEFKLCLIYCPYLSLYHSSSGTNMHIEGITKLKYVGTQVPNDSSYVYPFSSEVNDHLHSYILVAWVITLPVLCTTDTPQYRY